MNMAPSLDQFGAVGYQDALDLVVGGQVEVVLQIGEFVQLHHAGVQTASPHLQVLVHPEVPSVDAVLRLQGGLAGLRFLEGQLAQRQCVLVLLDHHPLVVAALRLAPLALGLGDVLLRVQDAVHLLHGVAVLQQLHLPRTEEVAQGEAGHFHGQMETGCVGRGVLWGSVSSSKVSSYSLISMTLPTTATSWPAMRCRAQGGQFWQRVGQAYISLQFIAPIQLQLYIAMEEQTLIKKVEYCRSATTSIHRQFRLIKTLDELTKQQEERLEQALQVVGEVKGVRDKCRARQMAEQILALQSSIHALGLEKLEISRQISQCAYDCKDKLADEYVRIKGSQLFDLNDTTIQSPSKPLPHPNPTSNLKTKLKSNKVGQKKADYIKTQQEQTPIQQDTASSKESVYQSKAAAEGRGLGSAARKP